VTLRVLGSPRRISAGTLAVMRPPARCDIVVQFVEDCRRDHTRRVRASVLPAAKSLDRAEALGCLRSRSPHLGTRPRCRGGSGSRPQCSAAVGYPWWPVFRCRSMAGFEPSTAVAMCESAQENSLSDKPGTIQQLGHPPTYVGPQRKGVASTSTLCRTTCNWSILSILSADL
jgi:hypothetical protein